MCTPSEVQTTGHSQLYSCQKGEFKLDKFTK